ncbi:MAG: 16S rRNA (uracil(1498)-N(3))-methyltransferase [Deltaproteobacteria bacterium]
MIRLLVSAGLGGERAPLDPAEAHYLAHVLRLRAGDAVEAFDGRGLRRRAVIVRLADSAGELELGERLAAVAPRRLSISLWQGLAKGEKLDWIVQKATELGVAEIVPFACARAVVRLSGERAEGRVARWRKVAEEAARQSGRAEAPEVSFPLDVPALAEVARAGTAVIALDPSGSLPLGQAVARLSPMRRVAIAVGPEGGFEAGELEQLTLAGGTLATLGGLVLRTETASVVACALAAFCAGDLG